MIPERIAPEKISALFGLTKTLKQRALFLRAVSRELRADASVNREEHRRILNGEPREAHVHLTDPRVLPRVPS